MGHEEVTSQGVEVGEVGEAVEVVEVKKPNSWKKVHAQHLAQ